MKKLLATSLLLTLYVPAGHTFFDSAAEDIPLYGEASPNASASELQVVRDTEYQGKAEDRLEAVSCKVVAGNTVPLKMINALRYSSRDKMKVHLKYDKSSSSYKVNVQFPTMITDCFKPSVGIKRYAGNFVVEVKNVYFTDANDKRPMMEKYESCLKDKGILKDGHLDRTKADFGTYAVSEHEVSMGDIFDGKDNIDHIEALFASPKDVPREFLTARSAMSPDQPNNCFNMEYFGGQRHDLLSKEQLAEHRFEWICDGNGNVLDVDHLLSTMPQEMGNYNNMVKDLQAIKASLQEDNRVTDAKKLREELAEALKKVKSFKDDDDRYEYEMAVNKYYEILTKLEEKDIKPLMEQYISLSAKVKKASGEERAKIHQRLNKIKDSLRFYDSKLSIDFANKLAKNGFYDEAKLTYMLKVVMEKKTSVNKKITVKDDNGKKRKVMLDSYEDMYDLAEYTFKEKSRAKYTDLRKQFQIKEEGAEYADDAYEKAQEIAKSADKRYNSFVEKMQENCKTNFFGYPKDKDKCEKYQKQWQKEAARRSKGYEIAGKYLGEAKKYKKMESDYSKDDEFGDDDDDFGSYTAEEFYNSNNLGSFQRYGTANSGQMQMPQYNMQQQQYNPFGTTQFGGTPMYQASPFGSTQFGTYPQQQYGTFGTTQFGTYPQQYNSFGTTQFGTYPQQQFGTTGTTFGTTPFSTGTTFGTQTTTTPVFR